MSTQSKKKKSITLEKVNLHDLHPNGSDANDTAPIHVNHIAINLNDSDADDIVPINIDRIAINQHGYIGYLYDAFEDNIKESLDINLGSLFSKPTQPIKCEYIKFRTSDNPNLLKLVGIDDHLRLSILLNMVEATKITSFINDAQPINQHSRLLYMYQESRIESCRDSIHKIKRSMASPTSNISATHIITEVIWGIHLIVILQLSPDQEEEDIDVALLNVRHRLSDVKDTEKINLHNRTLFARIISTKVYSNIEGLSKIEQFEEVYQKIKELQRDKTKHPQLKYILTPIEWFYDQHTAYIPKFISCEPNEIEPLEDYLLDQLSELKKLELRLDHDWPKLIQKELAEQWQDIQKDFSKIRDFHKTKLRKISSSLLNIRQGDSSLKSIDLHSKTETKELIKKLHSALDELQLKGKFIKELKDKRFKYCDVIVLDIKQGSTEQSINDALCREFPRQVIFCSDDVFRTYHHQEKWKKSYDEVIGESEKDRDLSLVYADFTYSTYALKKVTTIMPKDSITDNHQSNSEPSESNVKRRIPSRPPSPTDEYINILLLGESGVGKSTFINAFANYLHFQSLKEAEQGDPVVIIPVTFLMTINDNFDERQIKFGEVDPNENHNDFGQSVTQQCKSYVFNIFNKKKLRIIDTPGFGDTRGSDQDNLNMEEIFSFLNNITYLNGICLLFKPEVTQLNLFFRSCCTQIFEYFGKDIRNHLIFCFTNTRSTFFMPGNTRPLLNSFFESFPVKNIELKKKNTFCFDSESFRYLVAIRNAIRFDFSERKEFDQSWSRSVLESERFRDFLCKQDSYRRNDNWKSIKDAQFQINYMIRPMLEAMRNLLRNICLYDFNSSITLHATHFTRYKLICYTCKHTPEKCGRFWILPYQFHNSRKKCTLTEQKPIEYKLHYETLNHHGSKSLADVKTQARTLYEICATFSYFLMKTCQLPQHDSFLTGIERMIKEEESNCEVQTAGDLNEKMAMALEQLKSRYEKQLRAIQSDSENIDLSTIYDSIKVVNKMRIIKEQAIAIRNYHQHLLESNQHTVHVNESH